MPPIELFLKQLALVILVGGLIGAEREYFNKSAGFRTIILICLGSYLFTIFSISISGSTNDRIASNIVTGIGFIGAGVIYKDENRINGITTAATIWATAALGMGIASGLYNLVLISTGVILASLLLLTKLERFIDTLNQSRVYKIISPYKEELLTQYEERFRVYKLRYKRIKQTKIGENIIGTWQVLGPEKAHKLFVDSILHDSSVKEFEF
ncbi:MAG TPA: MgtC/SapB family protein [Flavisolibacter sp.]|nr:MgtC/SapB family protein [Flavisolibacter sp.]